MKNRHLGKIIGLYVLLFASSVAGMIGTLMQQDALNAADICYGLLLALLDLLLVSLVMMIIPGLCVLVGKGKMEYTKGTRICWFNSLILFAASYMMTAPAGISFVGGVGAILFCFINKWLFVQDPKVSTPKPAAESGEEPEQDAQDEEPGSEDEMV
jgi:hypothetical protein